MVLYFHPLVPSHPKVFVPWVLGIHEGQSSGGEVFLLDLALDASLDVVGSFAVLIVHHADVGPGIAGQSFVLGFVDSLQGSQILDLADFDGILHLVPDGFVVALDDEALDLSDAVPVHGVQILDLDRFDLALGGILELDLTGYDLALDDGALGDGALDWRGVDPVQNPQILDFAGFDLAHAGILGLHLAGCDAYLDEALDLSDVAPAHDFQILDFAGFDLALDGILGLDQAGFDAALGDEALDLSDADFVYYDGQILDLAEFDEAVV